MFIPFSWVLVWKWFGLVSLFNGMSTFVGYLMPNPFLSKNGSSSSSSSSIQLLAEE